jgi:thiosulfate/3-mercaptopyruvate sulfurtransferase
MSPGRHPLPPAAKFIATIGNAGIDGDTHVVIYDSAGGSIATRLWWLLRYYGHTRVSLLDGGWQAWQAANGAVHSGTESRPARQFDGHPQPHLMIDADGVEALRHDPQALILDARCARALYGRSRTVWDLALGISPGRFRHHLAKTCMPMAPSNQPTPSNNALMTSGCPRLHK